MPTFVADVQSTSGADATCPRLVRLRVYEISKVKVLVEVGFELCNRMELRIDMHGRTADNAFGRNRVVRN